MQKFIISFLIFGVVAGCHFFSSNQTKKEIEATNHLIQLGRYLFYDRSLSINNTKACATCHSQQFSFTDSYTKSIGALGDLHQRNSKPLINLTYNTYFTAADSSIKTLEQQMNNPMFNEHPIEMGIKGNEEIIINRIKEKATYQALFAKAFTSTTNLFSIQNIKTAIAAFEKTITSFNSPYDKFLSGDSNSLTKEQQAGMQLFFSNRLVCNSCHGGVTFSIPKIKQPDGSINFYHNIGLYEQYPSSDEGLHATTKNENDKGKFRVPTLRNLAFTSPYFHDGSTLTLDEVLTIYQNGGRNITTGVHKGDGRKNNTKSNLIHSFQLTLQERKALISFLFSLSDSTVLTNTAYANPFINEETK